MTFRYSTPLPCLTFPFAMAYSRRTLNNELINKIIISL